MADLCITTSISHLIGPSASLMQNNVIWLAEYRIQTVHMPYYWSICLHCLRKRNIIGRRSAHEAYLSSFISSSGHGIYHFAVYMYIMARFNLFICFVTCSFAYIYRHILGSNVIQFLLSIYKLFQVVSCQLVRFGDILRSCKWWMFIFM